MTGRTLPDDCRYPPASDAQIEEMQDRIAEYSAGDKTIATRIDWLGSFRRLLPMYWKYKQAAEYWKSWQDPDKIKSLEAENANLLAIAQGQREKLRKAREDINWMLNSRQFLNPEVFDYLDEK